MTEFWILAALVVLPGLLILVPPLLWPRVRVGEDLDERNLRIARERLAELEGIHRAGGLSDGEFEQAKAELEGNLLDDLRDGDGPPVNNAPDRITLAAVWLLAPIAVVALYLNLGAPQIIELQASGPPVGAGSGHGGGAPASMDEMIKRLEAKLKQNPDNLEGWFILGRSYMSERRYPEATRALEEAYKRAPNNANVLVSLADALAMGADGVIGPRAEELLLKAVELDPESASAYWLLGMARLEQGRPQEAIQFWQRAIPLLQGDANAQAELGRLIEQAKLQGGVAEVDKQPAPAVKPAPAGAEIRVQVSLAPALADKVSPEDTLFVLAKAPSGPPMPLAAVKLKASALPAEVRLDDSLAMMPNMKLSQQQRVLVQARISRGGGPMAQSGDLQSQPLETPTTGQPSLTLVIDQLVP